MPRRRVAVALLPPASISAKIQAVRSLLGDPRIDRIAPHLTLVPPVNLADQDVEQLQGLLRSVGSATTPFTLTLGPMSSFSPNTPTLHLAVQGDLPALRALREQLRVPPVNRPEVWPFTAHVTLRDSVPEDQIPPALQLFTGELPPWPVSRLYLLEFSPLKQGEVWLPILEEPFEAPVVVGRGGIELLLRTVNLLESRVAQLFTGMGCQLPAEEEDLSGLMLVVAERLERPGVPVAAAIGTVAGKTAELLQFCVNSEQRRVGIGRQVLMHWCAEAARRGAMRAVVSHPLEADSLLANSLLADSLLANSLASEATTSLISAAEVLQGCGFTPVGRSMLRELLVYSGE
ncbi:2'-5' RNA ligase [Actinobacteria bacterium IMCC26207]|nr:2'-5' RNA ligase [Actinobacteria bacterium IMCC26207]